MDCVWNRSYNEIKIGSTYINTINCRSYDQYSRLTYSSLAGRPLNFPHTNLDVQLFPKAIRLSWTSILYSIGLAVHRRRLYFIRRQCRLEISSTTGTGQLLITSQVCYSAWLFFRTKHERTHGERARGSRQRPIIKRSAYNTRSSPNTVMRKHHKYSIRLLSTGVRCSFDHTNLRTNYIFFRTRSRISYSVGDFK